MNWKLLLQLSLLGLIMAAGTVSLIPEKIEWIFWLFIFVFCAYTIAKRCDKLYFLHGFVLSLLNSVWITAIHALYCATYMTHHPDMSPESMRMPVSFWEHPRELMLITGPVFGIIFGLIQGVFSFIASKLVKK